MTSDVLLELSRQLEPSGLFVMGHLPVDQDSIVLVGADANFWTHFTQSREYSDLQPDPIDRWSKRLLNKLAAKHNGRAEFPSDGPPFAPFISWATESGRFWQSPTGMLIHDQAGLMISIRGALRLPMSLPKHIAATNPCDTCVDRPCASACPVSALSLDHFYDVPLCKAHLEVPLGSDCMSGGCLVRQVCPVSQAFNRPEEQSAFHMQAFMGLGPKRK
jgi:hypothetical protein